MDNLDDSENNAKISDSAYSNSCSNSQSRRSHSSKSTRSGSSGSSGYGGKPSTSGSSNKVEQSSKKDKDAKKKKLSQTEVIVTEEPTVVECIPAEPLPHCDVPKEEINNVVETPTVPLALAENAVENMDFSSEELGNHKYETQIATMQTFTDVNLESSCQVANIDSAGFACAISMHDGVVMYTSQNLNTNLGYPKDMWIGRSFIDFVHPKDRNTFASQVANGLVVPNIVNGTQSKVQPSEIKDCTMVCRIRRYHCLQVSFGLKDRSVTYMPFLLKFSFRDITEDDGKIVYLIIQATPIYSSYKTPNENKADATPFIIRHSAAGILEYIDIESVPYLGYLPQDIHNKDALLLYHTDDLPYLKMIYEKIVKEGNVSKSMPYRMLTQNGDYVKLETEWSSFINPWSMKLEFVIGKHRVVEGPATPDVFLSPPSSKLTKVSENVNIKTKLADIHKSSILRILQDVLTKPAEKAKQQMSKRCHDLALIMENLLEDQPKLEEELRVDIQEPDLICCERDSVMLGGISPHHEYNDSKSSTETPLSYNQLNYNENLQRYFDSHQNYCFDENNTDVAHCDAPKTTDERNCLLSPLAQNSDMSSSGSSTALMCNSYSPSASVRDGRTLRLTESLLTKHNNDMEKELAKYHRETRISSKTERIYETRQKKKEHLARCNATFQPTMAGAAYETAQPHGVKRPLVPLEVEIANKHHCSQSRQPRRRQTTITTDAIMPPIAATTVASTPYKWQNQTHSARTNTGNHYSMEMRHPNRHVHGAYPVYYAPNSNPGTSKMAETPQKVPQYGFDLTQPRNPRTQLRTPALHRQMPHYTNAAMPWMYTQPVYRAPYMYPQSAYDVQQQQAMIAQSMAYNQPLNPLGLPNNNYMQACKSSLQLRPIQSVGRAAWADQPTWNLILKLNVVDPSSDSSVAYDRGSESWPMENQDVDKSQSTEMLPDQPKRDTRETPKLAGPSAQSGQNSDETMDKTDGESSYSSFYSSFFKTESGSAEDSSDPKKPRCEFKKSVPAVSTYVPPGNKKPPRRKMDPPWMDQVCVTPDLVYKYQIHPKSKEEVLQADRDKMRTLEQSTLVNEQLGQLYLDLQLEGVAARLTLEEGITSSSSSGEDTCFGTSDSKPAPRRRREYSKLNMIYEEDAPFPPMYENENDN